MTGRNGRWTVNGGRAQAAIAWLVAATLLAGCDVSDGGPAEFESFKQSREVGDIRELSVDLAYGVGRFEIEKMTGTVLYAIDLDYDKRRYSPKADFTETGVRGSLRFKLDQTGTVAFRSRRNGNDLLVKLNDAVPLDLDITAGVSEADFNFTDLDLRTLALHGGVSRTEVAFDRPATETLRTLEIETGVGEFDIRGLGNARVERIDMKGGVGRTAIDFSGHWGDWTTNAEMTVGVGRLRISVPRDLPVEIEARGSFLSNVSAPSFDRNGSRYSHNIGGGQKPKLVIRVQSGVGSVAVELM